MSPRGATHRAISRQVSSGGPTVLDSFERTSPLNAYSGETGAYSEETTTVYDGGKSITASVNKSANFITRTDKTVAQGDTIDARLHASSDGDAKFVFGVQSATGASSLSGYQIKNRPASSEFAITRHDDGSVTDLAQSLSTTGVAGDWARIVMQWGVNGSITASIYDNTGTEQEQISTTDTTYTSGGIGWGFFQGTNYYDFARKGVTE